MDSLLIIVPGGAGLFAIAAMALSLAQGRRLSRIELRFDARVRQIEDALIKAPSREDVEKIDARLDNMALQLAVVTEQLKQTSSGIGRIEDYLIQRGAKHAE